MAFLQAINISKIFKMGEQLVTAIHDITVSINTGEFLAITGASGSGKSTLMYVLGCLDKPTSGTYLFDNKDVAQLTPDQLAHIRTKHIGFVFQRFNLLPSLTALDNVALAQLYAGVSERKARKDATELLQKVGLQDRLYHYPYQLSGGQQQRVSIARALVNNPSLILADEPTGNLDTKTGDQILTLFRTLNKDKDKTVIIVTHDPTLAQKTERIIHLQDGKIIEDKNLV